MAIESTLNQQIRETAAYAGMVARLIRDLPPFLRTPLTLNEAAQHVQSGLARRDRRFLAMLDRAVWRQPRSPYRALLQHAGCEPGDVRALVTREGLEGALQILAAAGVYVEFDELRGARPLARGSLRLHVSAADFDAPGAKHPHYVLFTGGSGGAPRPVRRSLGSVYENAAMLGLVLDAHGISKPHNVFWGGGSPTTPLVQLKLGNPIEAWYSPVESLPLLARAGLAALSGLAWLAGRRMPLPEYCDLSTPEPIALRIAQCASLGQPVFVNTTVSSAVRIVETAVRLGLSLSGVTFRARSEPLSGARRHLLEQADARVLTDYTATEVGFVGFSCAASQAPDDVHLCSHLFAAIEHRRPLGEVGPSIDALLLTALDPPDGKVAINAEMGDSATIARRECGCALGTLGLYTHLSEIRSFEKLSSEGTTFARSNLLEILEETLPARFGGSALDYQLVEEEGAGAATLLILHVHPAVGEIEEEAVRATLLAALGSGGIADAYQARLLDRASAVIVRRQPPIATPAGKVLPYHLARSVSRGDRLPPRRDERSR